MLTAYVKTAIAKHCFIAAIVDTYNPNAKNISMLNAKFSLCFFMKTIKLAFVKKAIDNKKRWGFAEM